MEREGFFEEMHSALRRIDIDAVIRENGESGKLYRKVRNGLIDIELIVDRLGQEIAKAKGLYFKDWDAYARQAIAEQFEIQKRIRASLDEFDAQEESLASV